MTVSLHASRPPRVYSVKCMLCGRPAGQLVDAHFASDWHGERPVPTERRRRCSVCGGSLVAEGGQPLLPSLTAEIAGLSPRTVRPNTTEPRPAPLDRANGAADADAAFISNVVENLQRRELSGRERVRAIALLAGLTDEHQRPLGVREISRRTGLATGTISLWLRLERRPALKAALETGQLDIGRAMKLVLAPEAALPELIERAGSIARDQLVKEVAVLRRDPRVVAHRATVANHRRALAAENCVRSIDSAEGPAREVLERLRQQLNALLGSQ